ncbi:hypothetical protein LCGC14_0897450 [marine sediment metagenome]|uniref:Uncharacterized protein n=1 Tax=marine sediment metagenome TaxID=412755 RepID=A0A0F9P290_9ZZZZ
MDYTVTPYDEDCAVIAKAQDQHRHDKKSFTGAERELKGRTFGRKEGYLAALEEIREGHETLLDSARMILKFGLELTQGNLAGRLLILELQAERALRVAKEPTVI